MPMPSVSARRSSQRTLLPTGAIRAEIDALFASDRDLVEAIGKRHPPDHPTAVEADVDVRRTISVIQMGANGDVQFGGVG